MVDKSLSTWILLFFVVLARYLGRNLAGKAVIRLQWAELAWIPIALALCGLIIRVSLEAKVFPLRSIARGRHGRILRNDLVLARIETPVLSAW